MIQSLKASDYRYQIPKRLGPACVAALLEAQNLSGPDRLNVLRAAYESPDYREAYATLLNNYANFNFLIEIMTDSNREKIIPILQGYAVYPGYKVSLKPNGKLWTQVIFAEALKIDISTYTELRTPVAL